MALEELYKRLELIGKGGFVSLSSSDWEQQSGLPERILRLVTAVCSLSPLDRFFSTR